MEINKEKSQIIIYNAEQVPESVEGIRVTDKIQYLAHTITNKKDIFKEQKENMNSKAQNLANMTYSVIAKSCHNITIGKAYWNSVCLPPVLYGSSIFNLTEAEINKLQTIENSVYRQILGAPKYPQKCNLRGGMGASSIKTRIIEGIFIYLNSTIQAYSTLT